MDIRDETAVSKRKLKVVSSSTQADDANHGIPLYMCFLTQLKKHLVTASYINDTMCKLHDATKDSGITILGEMGLDPGIDRMMAMSMINQAHAQGGKVRVTCKKKGNYKKSPNTKSSIRRISKEILKEKGPAKPKAAPAKPKRVVKLKVALVKSNVGKKKRLDEDVEVEDERVSKVEDERGSLMV
ncbi:hypothetical protein Tco_0379669 [Tanacetum coccineum]